MACKILVSNNSTIARAEIVDISGDERFFSKKESMQVFLAGGGSFEEWDRKFTIVNVTDMNVDDLSFLNETTESDPYIKKYVFKEPEQSSREWQDMYLTGEVTRPWMVVSQHIVERT